VGSSRRAGIAGELGGAQRHEHLADEGDRPPPEERRPREQEREAEELEDAGEVEM
jgi:hypothetical protein